MSIPLDAVEFGDRLAQGKDVELRTAEGQKLACDTAGPLETYLTQALGSATALAAALAPPVAQTALALMPDTRGRITHLGLQCPSPGFVEVVAPAWTKLAAELSPGAKISIAIPTGAEGESTRKKLLESIGHPEKLHFVEVKDGRFSQWSRDSMAVLQGDEKTVLMVPSRTKQAVQHPDGVHSDAAVPFLLAKTYGATATPSPWVSFDGGNLVNNEREAFIGQAAVDDTATLLRSRGYGEEGLTEVATSMLSGALGKPLRVLEQADFHADVFVTPVGENDMVIGDPRMALELLKKLSPQERAALNQSMAQAAMLSEGDPDLLSRFEQENSQADYQSAFDRVAAEVQAMGYNVKRVPYLRDRAGDYEDDPNYSYTNVLLEDYSVDGRQVKKAYMPVYGCPPLDQYASRVFQELGCQVVELPAATLSRRKGAIRCSSQVLERDLAG